MGPWLLVALWRKGRHLGIPLPHPGFWNCWEQPGLTEGAGWLVS